MWLSSGLKNEELFTFTLSLRSMYLVAHLAQQWIKERGVLYMRVKYNIVATNWSETNCKQTRVELTTSKLEWN